MVVNNLWKMEKGKLAYDNPNSGSNMSFFERELEEKENKKCSICSSYGEYLLSCENCLTWAHPSCAFLGGWDFEGDIV